MDHVAAAAAAASAASVASSLVLPMFYVVGAECSIVVPKIVISV